MTAYPGPGTAPLTIPVGYPNAPGYPGSLTTATFGASSFVAGTTYRFYDFTGQDLRGIAVSNVTLVGCLITSNRVADAQAAGSSVTACSNVTFSYCTFKPSGVSSPPVAYGSGNQYCIDQRKISGMTIDHCDMWGFGEAIQLASSSQSAPVVITNNFIHDASANGGGAYHVDGVLSSDGAGITYVTVSGNTIAIPTSDTNCIAFQVPTGGGGTPYSHLTITGNYLSGDNITVDVGTGTVCDHIQFTGNVWAADYEPGIDPLYSSSFLAGAGSSWYRNTMFVPSASPLAGANSSWMAAGNSGLYWWPEDSNPTSSSQIVGHTADYGAAMIAWRAGAAPATNNTANTSWAVTIPATVQAGDTILIVFSAFNATSAGEVMQASSTGSTPALVGTVQNEPFSGFNVCSAVFSVLCGAADAGKVITGSLASSNTAKWAAALGAWSGCSAVTPVDVNGAAVAGGASSTLTCPTETTVAANDWAVTLIGVALGGSAYTGPGAGWTQRESVVDSNSGAGAAIFDGNAATAAGTMIGGAVFANAGNNSWWTGYTIGLAPPPAPPPVVGAGSSDRHHHRPGPWGR